ncbi:ubiquinone/menaquinone biosynthesis C-methyltransferase UbiE [Iodidimonas muriae]|uniref:Ubiquinone/menaquinone biosynthesis C-methyltransferase UbiE n=1 Tax=Iodidimonas muriae TaxID=261467 RepID=A0ABQ2LAN9_9PROT|nr:bifunctional demethylmenaquinone methyltransferase/2-methoxy-6-polyprenyl-1,4-benzoquinol methylase UbiE [Iodidimonas muriae]GER05727.1 ubiquinone/menaquinone biosynthesis C-methyltransferase UbiE [Kordiimonadales bacterium JCM 17843]GGO06674.1 ubiquinone/menaquinone biosynthesis C-methyltransferase UbiE [Iodidimonas muriae]
MSSTTDHALDPQTNETGTEVATAWFGNERVAEAEKARRVHDVFAKVASRYDLMNDFMSGGLHRLWKSSLIDTLNPRPGMHLLDVAGGTGDIAFRFLKGAKGEGHVTILDINDHMLAVGRDRAEKQGLVGRIDWTCGDAQSLPLPDRTVDAYSIAFGIRNVTKIPLALAEAHRVLKFGGRFLCLEFCPHLAVPFFDRLYARYSDAVIPRLGGLVAKDEPSYRYLVESIRRFPAPETFAQMMRDAGFETVTHRLMSGGVCALHSGWKL